MVLNGNAVNLFWKIGDERGHAMFLLLQNGMQDDTFHNHTGKRSGVKFGVIDGAFFCSRENIGNGNLWRTVIEGENSLYLPLSLEQALWEMSLTALYKVVYCFHIVRVENKNI